MAISAMAAMVALQAGGDIIGGVSAYYNSRLAAKQARLQGTYAEIEALREEALIYDDLHNAIAEHQFRGARSGFVFGGQHALAIRNEVRKAAEDKRDLDTRVRIAYANSNAAAVAAKAQGNTALVGGIHSAVGRYGSHKAVQESLAAQASSNAADLQRTPQPQKTLQQKLSAGIQPVR